MESSFFYSRSFIGIFAVRSEFFIRWKPDRVYFVLYVASLFFQWILRRYGEALGSILGNYARLAFA